MASLIIMCCYDTIENGRTKYTQQTLESLRETVCWAKGHDIVIVDNNSCEETKELIKDFNFSQYGSKFRADIISLPANVGTANAVNLGIKERFKGQNIVKIDNDCVIHHSGWIDEMEAAIEREPSIGILGLKRRDLAEWPLANGWAKSEFLPLPHEAGQDWICVEIVNHVMGTCQMVSSELLDKIGGYYQGEGNVYGFDDSLLSLRSTLAGFKNGFLFHIPISHVDAGGDAYSLWKHQHATEVMGQYNTICEEYKNGTRDIFYNGE